MNVKVYFLIIAIFVSSPVSYCGEDIIPPDYSSIDINREISEDFNIIFYNSSDADIYLELVTSNNSFIKSLCIKELSKKGDETVNFLENKMKSAKTNEEKELLAEIFLNMSNERAKILACKYYIQQFGNINYEFKDYYNYPKHSRIGASQKILIIINDVGKDLYFTPSDALIPLLRLGNMSLPYLVPLLDIRSNLDVPLNAYWGISWLLKKDELKFGDVWQNSKSIEKYVKEPREGVPQPQLAPHPAPDEKAK